MQPSHVARLLVFVSIAGLMAFPFVRASLCCSYPKIVGCAGGCATDCVRPPWCDDDPSEQLPSSLRARPTTTGDGAADQVVAVPLGPRSFFDYIVPPSLFDSLNPCVLCDWNVYFWYL